MHIISLIFLTPLLGKAGVVGIMILTKTIVSGPLYILSLLVPIPAVALGWWEGVRGWFDGNPWTQALDRMQPPILGPCGKAGDFQGELLRPNLEQSRFSPLPMLAVPGQPNPPPPQTPMPRFYRPEHKQAVHAPEACSHRHHISALSACPLLFHLHR